MGIKTETWKVGKIRSIEDRFRWYNIYLIRVPEEKRENVLKNIWLYFLRMDEVIKPQTQEDQQILSRINNKKTIPRLIKI